MLERCTECTTLGDMSSGSELHQPDCPERNNVHPNCCAFCHPCGHKMARRIANALVSDRL